MPVPHELPLPPFFEPDKAGQLWKVPYQARAEQAQSWAKQYKIKNATEDQLRITLLGVDVQNTFCLPDFELFVAGRSGRGAVEDNQRLVAFIYRNLGRITSIVATMDTHHALQIFHPLFLINAKGEHPNPMTLISAQEVADGKWKFNPAIAERLGIDPQYGQRQLLHYTQQLQKNAKYDLTIWPYHAMLGGVGHALVPVFEEALFFHSLARSTQPDILLKGDYALTESYSAIGPEVIAGPDEQPIGKRSPAIMEQLLNSDILIIAGQAKSHCVAWTTADLLEDIRQRDERLAGKVYLLEDCSSAVVVPGVVDYTEPAEKAYRSFVDAGMHVVRSSDPIDAWPDMQARLEAVN